MVVADPLANSWARYHWAERHMDAVDQTLRRGLDPQAHTIALKVDVQAHAGGALAFARIGSLPIIHTDCALAIGDALHSFRSALDYLAWDLVRTGSDPHPKRPEDIYFPMTPSFRSFKRNLEKMLPGVPENQRAIIRRYQPYRRGDGPKALRWLRNLSDKDKHRVLLPTVMNLSDVNLTVMSNWQITSWEYLHRRPGALHIGTKLLRIELGQGSGQCEVNVQGAFLLFPSLGYGIGIMEALAVIRDTVFEILATFDEML